MAAQMQQSALAPPIPGRGVPGVAELLVQDPPLKPLHLATSFVRVGVESGAAGHCSAAVRAGVSHSDSEHATMALIPGAR